LLGHFSEKFAREMHRDIPEFTDEALRILRNYVWHGNVRELENLVQRLMVMVDGPVIDIPDLPEFMRFHIPKNSGSLISLAEAEEEHIRRVLSACDSNKTKAARILGIDRKTLREKLKE
jgi:DNA-binding NtrC family response regulator